MVIDDKGGEEQDYSLEQETKGEKREYQFRVECLFLPNRSDRSERSICIL